MNSDHSFLVIVIPDIPIDHQSLPLLLFITAKHSLSIYFLSVSLAVLLLSSSSSLLSFWTSSSFTAAAKDDCCNNIRQQSTLNFV